MTCGRIPELLLHAHVDGELDPARSLETEAHLAECPDCAARVENQRALRSALEGASLRYDAPASLETRIRRELARAAGRPAPASASRWRWVAMAASLPLVAVLAWTLVARPHGPSTEDRLDQEIVSAHVRSLMADHLTDVPSSDQHTVKPWFAGKLDFSPEVRDLATDGYPLVGGRLDYLDQRAVAALVYERGKHAINVFIWPASSGATDPASGADRETTFRGYHVIRWRRAGTSYAVVSDLNLPELRELARHLQR